MSLLHIRKILNKNIAQSSYKKGVESARILEVAQERLKALFPEHLALKVRPAYVKNYVVYLLCDSSAVVQEVTLYKRDILEYLHDTLGKGVVHDIRIQIG